VRNSKEIVVVTHLEIHSTDNYKAHGNFGEPFPKRLLKRCLLSYREVSPITTPDVTSQKETRRECPIINPI
jgi:hypothetical protein